MSQDENKCFYCGKPGDLRPYGPGGNWLCFFCMKSTRGREEEAVKEFLNQAMWAGPVVVVGEATGPRPYKKGDT